MEGIKIVAMYAGYCVTFLTLLSLIIKPLRERIFNTFAQKELDNKQSEQLNEILSKINGIQEIMEQHSRALDSDTEALKCSIRNNITHLYYKYTALGYIPVLERENVSYLYEAYAVKLQGNSYVEQCYKELMALPIKDN